MYLAIPDIFLVPVRYDEEDILNIKKMLTLKQYNYFSDFTNKSINIRDIMVGISLPTQREERWVRDKETMEKYAQSKGITVRIENADTDAAKQAAQVDNLISQGINVLILAPVDLVSAAEIVEKAHKAGIKVINYDRLIENSNPDLYTSFNNIRIGELQGQFLIDAVPHGNYIIMSGDPRDLNSKLLKEGAMEYLKPLVIGRDIKIVTDEAVINWDPKNASNIVSDALINNKNKINAILAPNDAIAGAAIQVLQEKGLTVAEIEALQEKGLVGAAIQAQSLVGKVAVTGQDAEVTAIRRIIEGTQLMTVFKDTRELGKAAIDGAVKLASGEAVDITDVVNNGKVDVPSILFTPIAIDKNNIDSVLINSGYLKKEQVYKT